MTKEKAKFMKQTAELFALICGQVFGKNTRVELTFNPGEGTNVQIYVGPIGKYDEYYDYEGKEWLIDQSSGERNACYFDEFMGGAE